MEEIVVKPLNASLAAGFLHFFDRIAFSDNPDWAGCYCQFYLIDPRTEDWETRSGAQNRAEA